MALHIIESLPEADCHSILVFGDQSVLHDCDRITSKHGCSIEI